MLDLALAAGVGLLALTWGSTSMDLAYGAAQGAALVAGSALGVRAVAMAVTLLVTVIAAGLLLSPGPSDPTEVLVYMAVLAGLGFAANLLWNEDDRERLVHRGDRDSQAVARGHAGRWLP